MNKITDYSMVCEDTIPKVWERMNYYIRMGWQPFGSLLYNTDTKYYIQPLVKYEL